MPRLGIAKEFLASYAKLEKPVRKAVEETLGKFTEHTFAGLHLEKLQGAMDPKIRTIRITNFWRGVVLAPDQGDQYHLLTVLPHDKANAYAASKRFTVNEVFGVVDVRDQMALEALQPALQAEAASATQKLLFSHVKDRLNGYRSEIHGRRPVVDRFPNWQAELDGIVAQVREWLTGGVEAHAVGIATRNRTQVKNVRDALDRAGIANTEKEQQDAVRVGTMHGMKGLEFRCVSVAGVEEGSVPSPAAARDMLYVSHTTSPSRFLVRQ